MNVVSSQIKLLGTADRPLDPKGSVGVGLPYESINDIPMGFRYSGMKVEDIDTNITWQFHYIDDEWVAKIYDGKFSVRAVSITSIASLSGAKTIDGISCIAEDVVLLVGQQTPHMNGVWVLKSGAWERHPLFASSTDGTNFPGITFIVREGTLMNSQWEFTNVGVITMSDDIADFFTATWLDFEATDPSKNGTIKEIDIDDTIMRFDKVALVDASNEDVEVMLAASIFLNEEYLIQKVDQSANIVIVKSASTTPQHVLLEQNDWVKVISTEVGVYSMHSNRINKLVVQAAVTSNGKLGIDVPAGYAIYSLVGLSSADVLIDIGTTTEDDDLGTVLFEDGVQTVTVLNSSTITEIWVSSSDWNSASVVFEMLIIKEG